MKSNLKIDINLGRIPILLTVVFVVLKLVEVIKWSWWWVFAPLWITAIIGVSIFIFVVVIAFILASAKSKKRGI